MTGKIKLQLNEVDYFCSKINTLDSDVYAKDSEKTIDIKSLLSILTLNLSEEIIVYIDSENKYELDAFKDIITRYGGKIID